MLESPVDGVDPACRHGGTEELVVPPHPRCRLTKRGDWRQEGWGMVKESWTGLVLVAAVVCSPMAQIAIELTMRGHHGWPRPAAELTSIAY